MSYSKSKFLQEIQENRFIILGDVKQDPKTKSHKGRLTNLTSQKFLNRSFWKYYIQKKGTNHKCIALQLNLKS